MKTSKYTKSKHREWQRRTGRRMALKSWAAEEAGGPHADPKVLLWCDHKGLVPLPF